MLTFVTVNGEGTPHIHKYEENEFEKQNIVVLCDYCPICDALCEEMDYLGDDDPVLIGAYILGTPDTPVNIELLREDQKAPKEVVDKIRAWYFNDREETSFEDKDKNYEDDEYPEEESYEDDLSYGEEDEYEEDW